jgi:hypothetical protein
MKSGDCDNESALNPEGVEPFWRWAAVIFTSRYDFPKLRIILFS